MSTITKTITNSIKTAALHFIKLTCFFFGSSLLVACGSAGSEDSRDSTDSSINETSFSPQSSLENTKTISGSAIKGVIRNGLVSAYKIVDGSLGDLLGYASTDENGEYSIEIAASYDDALKIIVTSKTDSDTEMLCDASNGCGDYDSSSDLDLNGNGTIDFGEAFVLSNDFELTAVVAANDDDEITVNVTSVTHMAATFAATLSSGLDSEAIESANSQVTQLFNLAGDLLTLTPVDLTDEVILGEATQSELIYSLLSSAVAALTGEETLAERLSQLAQNFADLGGQLILNGGTGEITLADLAQEALNLADDLGLDASSADISQLLFQSQVASANSVSTAAPSPTAGSDDLSKAKALVDDLQLWQGIIRLEAEPTLVFGEYRDALRESIMPELLGMQVAMSATAAWGFIPVLPEMAVASFCGTLSSSIMRTLCNSLVSANTIESMCDASGLTINGIDACGLLAEIKLVNTDELKVTYDFFEGYVTVVGTLLDQEIDMTMSTNAESTSGLFSSGGGLVSYNMSGTIENDSAILTISTGTIDAEFEEEINILKFALPENIEANFIGTLSQKVTDENDNPVSYTGSLSANIDLSNLLVISDGSDDQKTPSILLQEAAVSLGNSDSVDFEIALGGTLSTADGDTLDSSLIIHGGSNSYYSMSFDVESDDLSTNATAIVSGALSTVTTETENEDGSTTSSFEFLSEASASLEYDGRRITIEKDDPDAQQFTILNQDNVLISLDLSEDFNENLSENTVSEVGTVSIDGETIAAVTRNLFTLTFTFTDDSTSDISLFSL